jgi:predicted metal-binding membrane protein
MAEPMIERALKRDQWIVIAALAAVIALSWIYIASLAQTLMPAAPAMGSMPGMAMKAPPPAFAFLFAMWAVMMVGMMTPSAAPMVLIYARVARGAAAQGKVFAPTIWFALGYLAVWIGFSLAAAAAQLLLQRAALMTPMMALAAPRAAGAVLIAAGLYQWTPLKDSCLSRCRSPLHFVQDHGGFKPGSFACVRLGALHGLYCLGCCWTLMLLLFAAGIMNLIWIAALTALVLSEKALPTGRWLARAAGGAFVILGVIMIWSNTDLIG